MELPASSPVCSIIINKLFFKNSDYELEVFFISVKS